MIYVIVILLAYISIVLTLNLDELKHKIESIRVYLSDILMLARKDSDNIKKIVDGDSYAHKSLIELNYRIISEFEKVNFNLKELNEKLKTTDLESIENDTCDIRAKLFDIENNLERINIALNYLDEKNHSRVSTNFFEDTK